LAVKAGFSKSSERPKQVYLSLKKKGTEINLSQNVYGSFNVEKERFQFTLDIQNDLQHFNGDYELSLHIADFRASNKGVWALGDAAIWFK
jgi:Oligosaccharyltransferase subunit Ribophorin II